LKKMENLPLLREMYNYTVYGLHLESEIRCPELQTVDRKSSAPDGVIRIGKVPERLGNPKTTGFKFEAKKKQILLKTDYIANFLVSDGHKIMFQPRPVATQKSIRLLLLGWAMGALLQQKNIFPLHGCTLKAGDQAIILCGSSGSGKSTLARTLVDRGIKILDDNIAVIDLDEGKATVRPGYPEIKLWDKDIRKRGEEISAFEKVYPRKPKFAVPLKDHFYPLPLPIGKVFILQRSPHKTTRISLLHGKDKIKALIEQTFCRRFLKGLDKKTEHFRFITLLSRHLQLYLIEQPTHPDFPNILLDRLAEKFPELRT